MLPKLSQDLHDIELKLVPMLIYKTDNNMATRLKKVEIRHSQIVANIKQYEFTSTKNFDIPLSSESNLTLRRLIMDLRANDGEHFAITITKNWQGPLYYV